MMRLALITLAALALFVALIAVAAAVIMPAGSFSLIHLGRYSVSIDRFKVTFIETDLVRGWVPLAFFSLILGVPSAIYLGKSVLSFVGRRKEHRGFDVTPPPR